MSRKGGGKDGKVTYQAQVAKKGGREGERTASTHIPVSSKKRIVRMRRRHSRRLASPGTSHKGGREGRKGGRYTHTHIYILPLTCLLE